MILNTVNFPDVRLCFESVNFWFPEKAKQCRQFTGVADIFDVAERWFFLWSYNFFVPCLLCFTPAAFAGFVLFLLIGRMCTVEH